jgi:hypothetical protein
MYPFPPFALLASDIQHMQFVTSEIEYSFCYTCCSSSGSDYVLDVWLEGGGEETGEVGVETIK